ncbi:hypothetical protein [Bradyrhizobium sp. SZCCHNR3058]|uniref:hypothetical protein n=1 Tax=Bradyrhizobium sp. SZCCHNR3058 TaxID=3057423 RepID=UPI00396739C4
MGYFREDKGIEEILYALHALRRRGLNLSYRIAGEPQAQFVAQASYKARIESLVETLGLQSVVQIDDRYLSLAEQAACIQQAHLGIFCYQDPSHASSGTIPLVMAVGRPVLCTPFEYASVKAEEGDGVFLSGGFGHSAIASAIESLTSISGYPSITRAIYNRTRPWTWPTVGKVFEELYLNIDLRKSLATPGLGDVLRPRRILESW